MPKPTPVDDVVVTGQRRNDRFEPFPRGMMVPVPPPPGQHDEKPMLEPAETIQCALLPNRRAWNSDAAAAAAVTAFGAYAQQHNTDIFQLEHGAYLKRVGHTYFLGNIKHGTHNSVNLDNTGVGADIWAGDVHTHPSGSTLPSPADWDGFQTNLGNAQDAGRTDLDNVYFYIIAKDDAAPKGYRIYAYDRHWNGTSRGPEVDPDGTPCPA